MNKTTFWSVSIALALMVVFAFGWGGPAVRFPLALGILRMAFFVVEQAWPRVRV